MKLSAPIYRLKRQAKLLARESHLPLHSALDRVAQTEGFASWSLLAATHADRSPAARLYPHLRDGELILIAARPGQGKTLFAIELMIEAMLVGSPGAFFSLEYTFEECQRRIADLGHDLASFGEQFLFDGSDELTATLIADRLANAPAGTFAVVDYLQLLDQRRINPPLDEQVRVLHRFARERSLKVAVISQIDRKFESAERSMPGVEDLRLPNPVDLNLFDRKCFLHEGEVAVR